MTKTNQSSLWKYLEKTYGVSISYCDTGWQIRYRGETHGEGDIKAGMMKAKLGIRPDLPQMHRNILKVVENLHGLMYEQIHNDAALREMLAVRKINSRRVVNNG